MLNIKQVSYRYSRGGKMLLRDLNLFVGPGDNLGIVGPNGCGKSTVVKLILGIQQPVTGSVLFHGSRVSWEKHYRKITYVGDPEITTENLGLPANKTVKAVKDMLIRLSGKQPDEYTEAIFKNLKIDELYDARIGNLSSGERKRVMLALLFLQEPELVILDEPFEWVDPEGRKYLRDLLKKKLYENPHTAVILISHNDIEVDHLTDKVFRLENGALTEVPQKSFHVKVESQSCNTSGRQKKGVALTTFSELMDKPSGSGETISIQLKRVI